jgi:hypothetical protein
VGGPGVGADNGVHEALSQSLVRPPLLREHRIGPTRSNQTIRWGR